MPGVGLEGDGAMLSGGAEQPLRHAEIDQCGEEGDRETEADLLQRGGKPEAGDGGDDDTAGGHDDEEALETAGEVLGLVMAEGVLFVGRLFGYRKGDEGGNGG